MKKNLQFCVLSLGFFFFSTQFYLIELYAQDCGAGCYPYKFCPPDPSDPLYPNDLQVHCASCPIKYAQSHGLTVYAPGLPNCYHIDDSYQSTSITYTDPTTGHNSFIGFETGWNGTIDQNVSNAINFARNQYESLCPTAPHSNCCLTISLTIDSKDFTKHGKDPATVPAITPLQIDPSTCALNCLDGSNDKNITYLNFTTIFQKSGTVTNPYNDQGFWNDEDISNIPDPLSDYITLYSLSDVIMHELGHFVGAPDEVRALTYPCQLDGFLGITGASLARVGLTDMEKCFFKQLYCPTSDCIDIQDACTDIIEGVPASYRLIDPFLLVSIIPNPSKHQTVITYTLGRAGHVQVDLFDLLGKLISTSNEGIRNLGTSSLELNLDALRGGAYYARILVDGIPHTFKIIKAN